MTSLAKYKTEEIECIVEYLKMDEADLFLSMANDTALSDMLIQHFPRLIPILLKNAVYDEDDPLVIDHGDELSGVVQRAENIKPRHHKSKNRSTATPNEANDEDEGLSRL